VFDRLLNDVRPGVSAKGLGARGRRWVYVPEDQLSARIGPLADATRPRGAVIIESRWKASLRPYHIQRLAVLWSNQRQFALELARDGVDVLYITSEEPFATTLEQALAGELGKRMKRDACDRLLCMKPAERELRTDLAGLVERGALEYVPHEGWLTTPEDFRKACPKTPWKMDSFYRHVRQRTGVLMTPEGEYIGGKVSFDTENRRAWPGTPPAPKPVSFAPDEVTREVIEMVQRDCAHHPGTLDDTQVPATLKDAEALWNWARKQCLEHFGAYEDAMSVRSRTLFHTRVSTLVNMHRILPATLVAAVENMNIPLASKEGFIRQVLGWREFVRHVHDATDGFRTIAGKPVATLESPGSAGFERWSGKAWATPRGASDRGLGGATPAHLTSHPGGATPLPPAFWGAPSGMRCLDEVVSSVMAEGWSHHITRLMVLSNLATLLDINPRELTDWFWCAFTDAWDWVVEPNVLGMGTYAVGGIMTTKPYVAGSAYIDKMSDYCEHCPLTPGKTCPITRLYWAFLARHEKTLAGNPRLFMPMNALKKRSAAERARDQQAFVHVRDVLVAGKRLAADQLGAW
jgi:deoxyribodipyrimidine photolyase-related protein